jgi:hypothetical protein
VPPADKIMRYLTELMIRFITTRSAEVYCRRSVTDNTTYRPTRLSQLGILATTLRESHSWLKSQTAEQRQNIYVKGACTVAEGPHAPDE